jgi:hypothetical protein
LQPSQGLRQSALPFAKAYGVTAAVLEGVRARVPTHGSRDAVLHGPCVEFVGSLVDHGVSPSTEVLSRVDFLERRVHVHQRLAESVNRA